MPTTTEALQALRRVSLGDEVQYIWHREGRRHRIVKIIDNGVTYISPRLVGFGLNEDHVFNEMLQVSSREYILEFGYTKIRYDSDTKRIRDYVG